MGDTSLDIGLNNTNSNYSNFSIYIIPTHSFEFYSLFGTLSYGKVAVIQSVVTCIIICLGLPLTLGAIYGLCSLVRNGEVAPIYVINLLISDLIQFCCMIAEVARPDWEIIVVFHHIYVYSGLTSVGLMVCIALERYLVIVHPLWYHCRRTIKTTVIVCVPVWILPVAFVLTKLFYKDNSIFLVISTIFFLLPFPLLIFVMITSLKALSASISVPTDEKCKIAGMLMLVLLIYLLLFLPAIIMFVFLHNFIKKPNSTNNPSTAILYDLTPMFLKLSPLADLVLYIILRKGTIRQLLACLCRCRKQSNETSIVTV